MLLVRDEERWVAQLERDSDYVVSEVRMAKLGEGWMAQLDRDGDYVVNEGWVAKRERDGWLSWIRMVAMLLVRDEWKIGEGWVAQLDRDGDYVVSEGWVVRERTGY
jgi:hypothetical protein